MEEVRKAVWQGTEYRNGHEHSYARVRCRRERHGCSTSKGMCGAWRHGRTRFGLTNTAAGQDPQGGLRQGRPPRRRVPRLQPICVDKVTARSGRIVPNSYRAALRRSTIFSWPQFVHITTNVRLKSWGLRCSTPACPTRFLRIFEIAAPEIESPATSPRCVSGEKSAPGTAPLTLSQSSTAAAAAAVRGTPRCLFPLAFTLSVGGSGW